MRKIPDLQCFILLVCMFAFYCIGVYAAVGKIYSVLCQYMLNNSIRNGFRFFVCLFVGLMFMYNVHINSLLCVFLEIMFGKHKFIAVK